MRVRLEHPVSAEVDAEGRLLLTMPRTGTSFLFEAEHTGMWIALRRHDGRVDEASASLARRWNADRHAVREDLGRWVSHLCAIGLAHLD
ncbi:hypothetical protein [Saccharothrix xinjiangensis]|uniref:Coenzyme PQQ synthesis protein D (PqqD) n=1 Tax=Saccharothrix xinjiangensis TaxID=204798 RepID=A0ABV9XSV7_9PSEU